MYILFYLKKCSGFKSHITFCRGCQMNHSIYRSYVFCVIINENEFYFNFQLIIKISFYTKIHCTKSVTIYRACWYGFAYLKETFPVFLFRKLLNLLLLLIFSCLNIKPAVVLLFIRCIIHFIISVYLMYHIILID